MYNGKYTFFNKNLFISFCHLNIDKMKNEIQLWGLPPNKVYLKIKEQTRSRLFNFGAELTGNKTSLDNFLGLHRVHRRIYETGKYFCPLWVIKKILSICPEKEKQELMSLLEKSIEELRKGYGDEAKSIKNPKLPIKFSPTLCQIIGHVIGDGGIKKNYSVHYTNGSKILINQFKRDMREIFGDIEAYEFEDEGIITINFPSIVGLMLSSLFRSNIREVKCIPPHLLKSNEECKALFLRALFDDEGSVSIPKHTIEFVMANKIVVEDVKKMLKEFGIRPGKTGRRKEKEHHKIKYRFLITGSQDLKCFYEKINFDHPDKKERLRILIRSYKKIFYKKGGIEKFMFKIIKKEKKMTVKELAKVLDRKPVGRFYQHLQKLKRKNLIRINKGNITLV
ncbi:MAG: LAGLIDADG family homing endonuclease [Candidatus Aenigmarchaeota archaeon]|nr:LAGLIDADG family homing endonuclease [Candidatus Aenigmarchaeota archaeon]